MNHKMLNNILEMTKGVYDYVSWEEKYQEFVFKELD
jgi:hypothetical protein